MENATLVSQKSTLATDNILIVDDTPDNLRLLSKTLIQEGYKVRCAVNGSMALLTIKAKLPDLILLDINMPEMDGFEVCKQLKSSDITKDIPVIFVSALDEMFDKVKAFELGAVDYISKPFQIPEVLSRVTNQLSLQNLKKQLIQKNQLLEIEIINRIAAEAEIRQLNFELEQRVIERTLQLRTEIKERQEIQKELEYLVWNNSLTGLPNRLWLIKKLKNILGKIRIATIILDCNRFKIINDSLGRQAGDVLLQMIAQRLKSQVLTEDLNVYLTHFGEDKFAIVLENIQNDSCAITVSQKIHQILSYAFLIEEREIFITFNIGIVISDLNYSKPDDIFRDADLAIQKAKSSTNHYYQVFDATIKNNTLEILELETDLRIALKNQEFHLNYQPIISFNTGTIVGFETLVRWNHPQKGFISPAKFIPVAEQTNLILSLGMWILQQACQQIRIWQDRLNRQYIDFTVSVNISGKQFEQEDFIEQLDQIIADTGINIKHLKLEITETLLMNNTEIADRIFKQLKARQIQLAIDDFGTGYSSLSYLDRFPVDTLKIDRSFVSRLDEENQASTIVRATLDLAHNLGFNVVAEGVENIRQIEQLKNWGCEFAQGYFYSKPLDRDSAWQFLQENLINTNAIQTKLII
ncbi:EAL domain-containing protein [Waterburya agarophytonicola K14]|uniref:EAL domain-containing protein n=1 Tax=Waterburya agarophytonicola KI4 TaxID=2874699 RepID=A0A964BR88_9CYAN|nr:EAL domain-containing protein [Waterburya agarophytonicola]MCC0177744.1 EAL domain-containing protein [Waterburya agarophytonicola KI4]